MSDVNVKVKTTFHTQEIQDKIERALESGLVELGNQIEQVAYNLVAVKTGALRDSIETVRKGKWSIDIKAGGGKVPYAVLQELGHLQGVKYKFTPFLRPAFYNCTSDANLRAIFQTRIDNLGLINPPTIKAFKAGKSPNVSNIKNSVGFTKAIKASKKLP